jgi:Skp family chaperone for outer membrane proteins
MTTRTATRISVIFLSLIAFASLTHAQAATRVGYIDAAKLLKRMPEVKDASARLDQLTSSWTKEATDMQADIDRKQAEYDRRKLIMTDAERNTADLELTNMHKKHDDFLHSKFDQNGGDLFAQEAVLMRPAYDKLNAAIKDVAADGNYDYVFDRSSKDVILLYTNSKFDLTLPVARKLGIESEILSTPLVNNGPKNGTPPKVQPTVPGQTPPGAQNPGFGNQNPGTSVPNNGNPAPGQPGNNPSGNNPNGNNPNPPNPPIPGSGH